MKLSNVDIPIPRILAVDISSNNVCSGFSATIDNFVSFIKNLLYPVFATTELNGLNHHKVNQLTCGIVTRVQVLLDRVEQYGLLWIYAKMNFFLYLLSLFLEF